MSASTRGTLCVKVCYPCTLTPPHPRGHLAAAAFLFSCLSVVCTAPFSCFLVPDAPSSCLLGPGGASSLPTLPVGCPLALLGVLASLCVAGLTQPWPLESALWLIELDRWEGGRGALGCTAGSPAALGCTAGSAKSGTLESTPASRAARANCDGQRSHVEPSRANEWCQLEDRA